MISSSSRPLAALALVLFSASVPLSCSSADDSGGSSSAGSAGVITNAGSTGTGGAQGSGASAATGGSIGKGGATPLGGSAPTGGSAPAAGASATGGTVSTGGSVSMGGSTGGVSNSGGASGADAGGPSAGGPSAGTGGGVSPACASATPIAKSTCAAGESNCFSFFVASRARMFAAAEKFNGSTKGWGGDLRYGTADGLTGADKLCTEIAEQSLPGNCRTWRAFLSTSKVNAIDRVGAGPWYDRLNRTIANNLTELAETRPGGITVSTILNNLPNEDGTPHHNEEVGCNDLNDCADNHDVLTGSDTDGKLCTMDTCAGIGGPGGGGPGGGFGGGFGGGLGGGNITDHTCEDWTLGTSKEGVAPRCGHTWPTGGGMEDDWISRLTEAGCAPGYNLVQDGGPMATGLGSVGDGGGYGAIYCLALGD